VSRRLDEVLDQTPRVWERYAAFGAFGCAALAWKGASLVSASLVSWDYGRGDSGVRVGRLGFVVHARRCSLSLLRAVLEAWRAKTCFAS
jgi:hypothetical protein